ncbi:ArdC-like ssDNA-binding domain-containing protein [Myceligenerans halotolerans]
MSTGATARTRHPAGAPDSTGGQFAPEARAESSIDLAHPAPPVTGPDLGVFRRRYDTVAAKLEAIHGELDANVAALAGDAEWNAYLRMAALLPRYSFNNQLLILWQMPDATRVASFKTWKKLGRWVRKDEKGLVILRPRIVRAQPEGSDDGSPQGEENTPREKLVGFTVGKTFDVSQTDGEPLPEMDYTLSAEPPDGLIDDLEGAISSAGYSLRYEPIDGGREGYTTRSTKQVVVNSLLGQGNRAEVLAHELGHIAAGHLDKFDKYHTGHGGQRGRMELEAEAISYVLLRSQGMQIAEAKGPAAYVAGWTSEEPDLVKDAGARVADVVKDLLESGRFRNTVV